MAILPSLKSAASLRHCGAPATPTFANIAINLSFAAYGNLVAGDFNGDGKLDLAGLVPLALTNPVFVLLGNGDGTFQAAVTSNTGQAASFIVAADFNGDGRLDLAVFGNTASVLLGNGDGTFQTAKPFASGFNPGAFGNVAVADFNRDGNLDFALAENGSNSVSILLGNGDGTFQNPVSYSTSPNIPIYGTCCTVTGDFDGDGKLDLAFVDGGDEGIDIVLGNGDGTFQPPLYQNFSFNMTSDSSRSMTAADFNGDGRLDLLVTCGTGRLQCGSLLLGNGDGTFQTSAQYPSSAPSFGIGDFNSDGYLDLLSQSCGGSGSATVCDPLYIIFGNGDGSFFSVANNSLPNAVPNSGLPVVADLNGDGKLDLAYAGNIFLQQPQDFSVAPSSQSTATITRGQTASFGLTVAPLSGFTGTVALACGGAPPQSICSVSPNSLLLNGSSSGNVTVSIATTAASLADPAQSANAPPRLYLYPLIFAVLFSTALAAILVLERQWLLCGGMLVLLLSLAVTMIGCTGNGASTNGGATGASGGGGGSGNSGTPAGTYTLTITGTSGTGSAALSHSINITLIVQ